MNLGEHLNALFTNVGVSVEDAALKELVTKVAAIDINDSLVSKFNQSYMTEQAAKANSKIIGHFKAQHYNGLDDEIKPLYDELGIPEDVKTELFRETSSTKRVAALLRKVSDLKSQQAGASKGEKAELSKQIEDLNTQIKTEKLNAKAEIEKAKTEFDEKLKDVFLTKLLAEQKMADHYRDEDYLLPKTKLANTLRDKSLRVVLDGKDLKLQTEQGTDYFDNNSKVDFKAFTEKVLADNKFTEITEQQPSQKSTIIHSNVDRNKISGLSKFDAAIQEAEAQNNL